MDYPDWVTKYKTKGTAIHYIRGHYYLYEITSKWNKEKKRPQKITGRYLGVITPEGLQKPRPKQGIPTAIKEYGSSAYLLSIAEEIKQQLQRYFPDMWKEILVLSIIRVMYHCPLKHVGIHYQDSWLSEEISGARLSKNSLHSLLEDLGRSRSNIVGFLSRFITGSERLLIDLTHIFSLSEGMSMNERGYNSKLEFMPQVNLLFLFSYDKQLPLYYRLLPGNVRDVSSLGITLLEIGIEDAIIIGDKGFYSDNNRRLLEEGGFRFILPLKRNNRLIDYSRIKDGDKSLFDGYFRYMDRYIWYYRIENKGSEIWVYLDEKLRLEEENDYLSRTETHPEFGYTIEGFHSKQSSFGTVALITNLSDLSGEKIYQYYKSRQEIEQLFDTFKNILNADRTYMHDDYTLEGWMFINYLSLVYYYKIYQQLTEKKLLDKYSVSDILFLLSKFRKAKIANDWQNLELPKQTKTILKQLNLPIT